MSLLARLADEIYTLWLRLSQHRTYYFSMLVFIESSNEESY